MNNEEKIINLLQTLIIVQLAGLKVPQNKLKKIVGVSTNRVNSIVKYIKIKK